VSPEDRSAAWVALRDGLVRFLRSQARGFRGPSVEDLEDLASAKALELVVRAESGEWRLEGRSGGELAGYLATVARNGLIDLGKKRRRTVSQPDPGDDGDSDPNGRPVPLSASLVTPSDAATQAREFIDSLRDCLVQLQPRARRVWFYRVFYGMNSRAIGQHPSISLPAAHLDVVMQRARDSIRTCMQGKGFEPTDLPAGTFAALWEFLESMDEEDPGQIQAVGEGG
jgi:RNA polymerase sigma factor (sigma-70 family)